MRLTESTIVILAEIKEHFRKFYKITTDLNFKAFFKKSTVTYNIFGNSCFKKKKTNIFLSNLHSRQIYCKLWMTKGAQCMLLCIEDWTTGIKD